MTGLTGKELHTTREPVTRLAGWLAAWGMAGWLRPRKAREAQRGPERRTVDRTNLSCAWLEAPHKQICDQGGSHRFHHCSAFSPRRQQLQLLLWLQLAACSWFCNPLFLPPPSSFFANISFHFHWTIYPLNQRIARLLWRRQSAQIA